MKLQVFSLSKKVWIHNFVHSFIVQGIAFMCYNMCSLGMKLRAIFMQLLSTCNNNHTKVNTNYAIATPIYHNINLCVYSPAIN